MRNGLRNNASAAALLCLYTASLLANPNGPVVVGGSASFQSAGKGLTISTTPGAIINWKSFSIERDEITRFVQQNGASAVLNRVTGSTPSSILGQLSSNGRVFLINPNGVVVGNGAKIDVAGFVASSLKLSDADFRAGRFKFGEQPVAGSVINQGVIRTPSGGAVYLVGPKVENRGLIVSPHGEIILAAGQSVELINAGSPELRVQLKAPGNEAVNIGQLLAAGGSVGMYGALIHHGGVASASTAERTADGRIVFKAARDVTLAAGSKLDANSAQGGRIAVQAQSGTLVSEARVEAQGSHGKGGEVQLLGRRVGLTGGASVDASGASGGGSILVGGDYQGKNPQIQNAARTFVGPKTNLRANAGEAGDGGKVVLWSDEVTRAAGTIGARGGKQAGDGGVIEASSHGHLDFQASVDTTASNGSTGSLLLDPSNITISTGSNAGGLGSGPNFENGTGASVLNVTTLLLALAGSDVVVSTSPGSGGAGNITVQNAVSYTGTNDRKLTLQADNTITVTQAISASAAAGRLSVDLQADKDGSSAGDVRINNAITTRGGSFSASGVNITRGGAGAVDTTGTAGRNGGDITLTGTAAGAVSFGGNLIATGGAALAAGAGQNAGTVSVTGGTITLAAVTARGSNAAAASTLQGGNGGSVNIDATGAAAAITLNNNIDTRGGNGNGTGNGGNSGAVSIDGGTVAVASNRSINTTGGTGQDGGAVSITAAGTITFNTGSSITTSGGAASTAGTAAGQGDGRNAGNVTITSSTGAVGLRTVTARGSNASGSDKAGGTGGAFGLSSLGVTLNNTIDTRGGNAAGAGNGSTGGAQTIDGGVGPITGAAGANFNAAGGTGQNGGAINLTAVGGVSLAGTITSSGGAASAAGAAPGAGLGGSAGNVSVTGADVSVGAITAQGTSAAAASSKGGGAGGAVVLDAMDTTPLINLGGNIASNGGNGNGTGMGGAGGAVTVSDPAVLNANVAVSSSGGTGSSVGTAGAVQLQSVDSSAGARRNLTLTASNPGTAAITTGNLGATTPLGTVQIRGATVGAGSISTLGLANANGAAVTINADAGNLSVGAIVTSGQTGAGVGRNGGNVALTGRTVNVNGGVTNSGSNAVAGAGGNAGVVSITSNAAVNPLTVLAGNVSARGGNGATGNGGNGATVTFTGPVRLAADAAVQSAGGTGTVNGTSGNVTFSGAGTTIDSDATARALTITAGTGAVSLQAAAGGIASLAGVSASGNTVSVRAITSAGSQALSGSTSVTLNGTLQSTGTVGADTVSITGPVTLAGATTILTAGGAGDGISFSSTINGARTFAADAGTNGTLAFGANVGQATRPTSFSAKAGSVTLPAVSAGTIFAQSYTGDLTLNGVQTATAAGDSIVLASAANWVNNAGAAPMSPGAGRFLVYSQNPASNTFGGFVSTGNAFNRTYAANPPGSPSIASLSGRRMIYSITPLLAVTADDKSKVYGNADPALTFAVSGLVAGDTVGTALSGALTRAPGENASGYPITQGTLAPSSLGYSISPYTPGTLNVTQRPITLQASDQSRIYGDVNPSNGPFTLTSGNLAFSDSVASIDVSSPAALTAPVGSYTLSPTAANFSVGSASNYAIAFADGTLFITQRPLTVQATNQNRFYGDPNPLSGPSTITASSLVGTDTIANVTVTSPATATSGVGGFVLTPTAANFSSGTASNYLITLADGTLFVVPRNIAVVANSQSKLYGSADPAFTYVANGLVNADTLTGVLGRNPGETVTGGPYAIIQGTLTNASNPNYSIAFTNGQLVVTPKSISVVADEQTKLYGSPDPTLTYLANGLVGSDTLAGSLTRIPGESVLGGPYAIVQGSVTNAANPNYDIAYTSGGLTIDPAPLLIQANDAARPQGRPNPAFSASASGFQFGESVGNLAGSLAFSTPATTASPVGIYDITPSGVSSTNYTITFVDGQLVVTTAPIGGVSLDSALFVAVDRSASAPEGLNADAISAPGHLDCLQYEADAALRQVLYRCR